jgi:signal transduction histidine kinase
MTESDEVVRKLRHDIANPLGAILAEAQLQLLSEDQLPPDVARAFREIERLTRVIRDKLREV